MRHRELVQIEYKYFLFVQIQFAQPYVDGHKVDLNVVGKFKIVHFRISQPAHRNSATFRCEFRQRNEKPTNKRNKLTTYIVLVLSIS